MRAALLTSLAGLLAGHVASAGPASRYSSSLDLYILEEAVRSYHGIIDNLGNKGSLAPGTGAGLFIASPNTANPNYYYSWTRDSALTSKCLTDLFVTGELALGIDFTTLQGDIRNYISAQAVLQNVSNPSGTLADGSGLGEPKFEIDFDPFSGAWGRPQRDGPALRAMTMITYCNQLIADGQASVAETVWPIIANDLAYVGQYWNESGFDLWEETYGSSFFTLAVQHVAMVQGNSLAEALGKSCAACVSQAPQILCFLQDFWNGKYVVANLNTNNGRSGVDANTLLASIHTFDPEGLCDDSTFQPCSSRALANHKVYVDAFRSIYGVNAGLAPGKAANTGRYPEDVYYGGNPWYLCTLSAAELLYDALYQWNRLGALDVTDVSLAFFQDFAPTIKPGTYRSTSPTYKSLTRAIRTYADGFLSLVQHYTPSNGSLAEEYNRDTGIPESANDLTWSYASFLTAIQRRASIVPPSWGGETPLARLPPTCSSTASPATGTYTAIAPPFPTSTQGCNPATLTIPVTFYLIENTFYGENVFMTGNITQLGNWDTSHGYPLTASLYTQAENLWFVSLELIPPGTAFEYKYYKVEPNGGVIWEGGANRVYTMPEGCVVLPSVFEVWQQ